MTSQKKALEALSMLRTFTNIDDADCVGPLISQIKDALAQPINVGVGNLFSECKNFHQCAGLLSTMNFADKHPEHAFYVLNEFIAWFLQTHSDLVSKPVQRGN